MVKKLAVSSGYLWIGKWCNEKRVNSRKQKCERGKINIEKGQKEGTAHASTLKAALIMEANPRQVPFLAKI